MSQSPIHEAVAATLAEMGLCKVPPAFIRTVLIRDGYFVGEKYRFDGGCAIWLAKTSAIEVYDDDQNLLKTVNVETSDEKRSA
jgi:hypothetical protein